VSRTDPEASPTTSSRGYHMEPSYKQHTAVDDKVGVVDLAVTMGEASEGLWNVAIQAYLTATVTNLKRLAALLRQLATLWRTAQGTRSIERISGFSRESSVIGRLEALQRKAA